ncbi:MAG TPA: nucleotide-binding protein [archaeon]|nr:nucleotide-binding protein [archaeon]
MKIILDTNFMMVPNQFGVDIFEFLKDYEIFTLSSCMDELKKIAKKKGKDGLAAKVALKLVKEKGVTIIKTKEKGDKSILNYAVREKCSVGTNDKELIAKLRKQSIKILRLRQKKYIEEI